MKKINYQGREIEAEEVSNFSGVLTTALLPDNWAMDHQGDEEIFRTPDGQYYLRRELQVFDLWGAKQRPASGRVQVHRISLKTAILWAIMRAGARTNDLRRDAAAVLTGPAVHIGQTIMGPRPMENREDRRGLMLDLHFELDLLHVDLLKTFGRRHQIDAATLTRAALMHRLGEIFDYAFNGGELSNQMPRLCASMATSARN